MAERLTDAQLHRLTERAPAGHARECFCGDIAAELLAYRQAAREWHEATDKGDLVRILPAEAALRALVKGE